MKSAADRSYPTTPGGPQDTPSSEQLAQLADTVEKTNGRAAELVGRLILLCNRFASADLDPGIRKHALATLDGLESLLALSLQHSDDALAELYKAREKAKSSVAKSSC